MMRELFVIKCGIAVDDADPPPPAPEVGPPAPRAPAAVGPN